MPINSRNKGASFEREVITLMRDHLGVECRRNLEQWRSGGFDVEGLPGFAIECKRHKEAKAGQVDKWWEQTVSQAKAHDAKPVLIYKADRQPIRVVLHDGVLFPIEDSRGCFEMGFDLFAAILREELNNDTNSCE